MKINFKARSWHTWVSVILAVPILIVGASAVFIAHKKSLGTESIRIDARWLPGYHAAGRSGSDVAKAEARAMLVTSQGETLIGTQDGLFRIGAGIASPEPVEGLRGMPVRGLAEVPFGRVAAAKDGIWVDHGQGWQRFHRGDAWSASVRRDSSVVVAVKDHGLLVSSDGREWSEDPQLTRALAAIGQRTADKPMTLHKLVMDLHTGQAFFGKEGEWLWIDVLGITLCLLALTGVVMWWRAERRKLDMART